VRRIQNAGILICEPKLRHTKCANIVKESSTRSKKSSRSERRSARARGSEEASERERDREYVGAGKEEDARRRATGYLSLPVSYSAGGPGGTGGVPTSTPVVRFLLLFTYYFLDLKNHFSATRDPSCKLN
jgi:hypothetical protein